MSLIRVDFYLLTSDDPAFFWTFVCRLIEKAYLKKHRVFAFCKNKTEAEHLDEQLWIFKENSFIPHNLQGEGPEPPPPVQIGYQDNPGKFSDILLNLHPNVPDFHHRFKRIIEIVRNDEETKTACRAHYQFYRQKQYALFTHEINSLR